MYSILSGIALAFEIILLIYVILQVCAKKTVFSKQTLWYSIPVYILVYYIYVIGYSYTDDPLTAFVLLRLLASALTSFTFKVEFGYVNKLAFDNYLYFAAALIAFLYAGATLVASVVAILGAKMRNNHRIKKAIKNGQVFVLGSSERALNYAKSNNAIIVAGDGAKEIKDLISKKHTVIPCNFYLEKWDMLKLFNKWAMPGKMYHFIAFQEDILSHEALINSFINQFKELHNSGFTLNVEASLSEMDVINRKFVDKKTADNICVKSFNKYELIARNFIIDSPMAQALPEDFYGECRTIKPDKKINVVFLGFGKVNYEILKLMVIQNQFVGLKDGRFVNAPVNYYIYDNSEDKISSDAILTLRSDMKRMRRHELPLPEPLCTIADVRKFNIFSDELTDRVDEILRDENSFTYIIVSVGSDLENISTAERFVNAYSEMSDRFKTFARTKDNNIANGNGVVCFGNESKILTNDVIVGNALDSLSKSANEKYGILAKDTISKFNTIPTIEKYSNIYHAISLFYKVGMLGYNFIKKENAEGRTLVSKEDLFAKYGEFDKGENYEKYFKINVWTMLGFSEHSRWVAQYVLNGFHQMPLSAITVKKDDGKIKLVHKDIDARLHCCLTDYYGLDGLHKYMVDLYKANGEEKSLIDLETYKYDYMLISDGYDVMQENGYVLVKNEK